jgi:DNA processing protein
MMPVLSANTQAILLLTAPLIAGRGRSSPDLLSPGEYKHLARRLREAGRQPADLLSPDAQDLINDCRPVVDETRLQRLLGRGFLLSQVLERWQSRAIWVMSRGDEGYPRRLKARLREDAPAVLYGCGDTGLLDQGGLAVVGSRNATEALIEYAMKVGRLAAKAGRTVVSGGARGIDQAAMHGALDRDGKAVGVLADGLEKSVMSREHRTMLMNGRLVLISSYDPSTGFNVGNAMRRNRLIYALADASLVVDAERDKGGTWAGAVEQLDKLRMVPVYVRSSGEISAGLDALRKMGAIPWPEPQDGGALKEVFEGETTDGRDGAVQVELPLLAKGASAVPLAGVPSKGKAEPRSVRRPKETPVSAADDGGGGRRVARPSDKVDAAGRTVEAEHCPADAVMAVVRDVLRRLLTTPMKASEISAALNVSAAQTRIWLQRLADEGVLEKPKRTGLYVSRPSRLFE